MKRILFLILSVLIIASQAGAVIYIQSTGGGTLTWYYGVGSDNYTNEYTYVDTDLFGDDITITSAGSITKISFKHGETTGTISAAKLGLYRNNSGTWELVQCCETGTLVDAANTWEECTLTTPYAASNNEVVRVHVIMNGQAAVNYHGTSGGLYLGSQTYAGQCSATETSNGDYEHAVRVAVQ